MPDLRRAVCEIIEAIRSQLVSGRLPGAPNDQRCRECQLRSHCLPELTSAPRKVDRYMGRVVFQCDT